MEKDIPCKWKSKETWGSNSHIRQNNFKIKTITRDKERHYIMIKGSIQEEDITIVNIYAPNIGAPKYIKQILTDIKGEIDRTPPHTSILSSQQDNAILCHVLQLKIVN